MGNILSSNSSFFLTSLCNDFYDDSNVKGSDYFCAKSNNSENSHRKENNSFNIGKRLDKLDLDVEDVVVILAYLAKIKCDESKNDNKYLLHQKLSWEEFYAAIIHALDARIVEGQRDASVCHPALWVNEDGGNCVNILSFQQQQQKKEKMKEEDEMDDCYTSNEESDSDSSYDNDKQEPEG